MGTGLVPQRLQRPQSSSSPPVVSGEAPHPQPDISRQAPRAPNASAAAWAWRGRGEGQGTAGTMTQGTWERGAQLVCQCKCDGAAAFLGQSCRGP